MKNAKTLKTKDTHPQKKVMDAVLKIYKTTGQECLFHLWQGSNLLASGSFYSTLGGGLGSLLPRGQCSLPVQLLQPNNARKYIRIWKAAWRGKSKGIISLKKTNHQVVQRGLPVKNKILRKIK